MTLKTNKLLSTLALIMLSGTALASLPAQGSYHGEFHTTIWPLTPCNGNTTANYQSATHVFTLTVSKLNCANGTTHQGFTTHYEASSTASGFELASNGTTVWDGSELGNSLSITSAHVSNPNYNSYANLIKS